MSRSSLFGGNNGSVIVEFAIIVPFIFAIIFAIIDLNRLFLAKIIATDTVAKLSNYYRYEVSPKARTTVTSSQVQSKGQTLATGFLTVIDVSVSVDTYQNISDMLEKKKEKNAGLLGNAGYIVKYTLAYTVTPFTPFLGFLYPSSTADQTVTLVSKNEN